MDALNTNIASILEQLTNLNTRLEEETAQRQRTQELLNEERTQRQRTQDQLEALAQQVNSSNHAQIPTFPPQSAATTPQHPPIPTTLTPDDIKTMIGTSRGPKVGTPDKFDGSKGDKAEAFINQVGLYLLANANTFPDDKTKVVFTLSYFTGEANQWAAPYFKRLLCPTADDHLTFRDFTDAFEATFFDSDRQNRAQRDLRALQQSTSVADYTTRFMALAARTGWGESEHISHYRIGLKQEIRVNMILKVFNSLTEISAFAIAIDNELHPGHNRQTTRALIPATVPTPRDPDAMDLSSARVDYHRAGVSREEMSKRVEKGLCFKCGKGRHRAADCGKKDDKGNWIRSGGYSKIAELEAKIAEMQMKGYGRADESKNGDARD